MEYVYLIFRVLTIFFSILIIIRILGKREVGELSIFDLVVLLMIADLGSIGIDEADKFLVSVICLIILLILQKILSFLTVKISALRNLLEGKPRVLIENGKINVAAMKKELYTIDDLITQLRDKKIMDLSEVSLAILETNGTLSVFRKEKYSKIRLPIILSGKICNENLSILSISKEKIETFFTDNHYKIEQIMYASYDGFEIYFYETSNNKKLLSLKRLSWLSKN